MRSRRLVFDGSHLAYWRYHAREKNQSGRTAIECVYDFVDEMRPDTSIIVLEGRGNWRHKLIDGYKSQRPPRPPGVDDELKWLETNRRGIPVIRRDDFEADDVIASLVVDQGAVDTYIVSNDKDLNQLICDSVLIYEPQVKLIRDAAAVRARWHGIGPEEMRAFLAVWGDKSDHVSGVPGLGEKRAAQLVLAAGWDGILAAIAAKDADVLPPVVSRALRELLVQFGERVKLNYELVGLRTDALQEHAA